MCLILMLNQPTEFNIGQVAASTTAGLPVSWPLPTAVQEQGRPTGATAATNAAARKNVSAAPVGREVVGAELDAIKQPLDALMEAMAPAHDTAPMAVRKRKDAQTRLEELYTKLSTGGCNDQTVMQISQLAQAVAAQVR